MKAYKLFRLRKNGTLGSLFINRRAVIPVGQQLVSEFHPTPGYEPRHGWHATESPYAPHLTTRGRVWCEVDIEGVEVLPRPKSQGGKWFIARRMTVLSICK